MIRFALAMGLVFALLAAALPARAQEKLHSLGDGALSADGSLLAFHTPGTPGNSFVVLEVDTGQSWRFVLPEPHVEMRDLVWSQLSNTLMFVSRAGDGKLYSAHSILTGHGTHVWSLDFTQDDPQPTKVIAQGSGFRWPALSPDGAKLAYFQPVPLPNEEPPNAIVWPAAYGVFERDLATGEAHRVAKSQYGLPRALYYDGADAWMFSADHPQYVHRSGQLQFWGSARPGAPPGKGTFDQLTSGIKSFRMERGEVLPDYPDFKRPWPAADIAPLQSMLVGVTLDGRPILQGEPGPENTAANQQRNMMSWYVDGVSRVPMRYGFAAIGKAGEREVYFMPGFAEGYSGNVGGVGIDAGLKRFFRIDVRMNPDAPETNLSTARLFLYEDQSLILQRDVSDIIAKAEIVRIAE